MELKRNYSLDLLKIISIIFVIILHYNNGTMGGLLSNTTPGTSNYFIARFTEILTIIACNLFVLISGYFLCKSNKIKIRKIVDIVILLFFYGIVIYAVSIFTGLTLFNKETLKSMFLTIDDRWFINIYVLLYILHPYINKIISNINKKQHTMLILICVFFFSVWSSILKPQGVLNLNTFVSDGGYGITNFIMLYFIGAYIRLYYDNKKMNKLILFIIYICLSLLGTFIYYNFSNAISYNFIINVINSIIVFLFFKNIIITKGKIISKFAECSLAIYIIHENSFIRSYIYRNIFLSSSFYDSSFLIINMIFSCIAIFIICAIIEFIRKYLFKITINKLIDKSKFLNKIISV